jgi:hypothetical protein
MVPTAPTFCNRCSDALEEGCDPWDDLAELDALLERDLKRKINQLQSPIIRQLPPDVTSTIFEFCVPDFADHQILPYTKEDHSIPLSLGAICSYWREIAWSTPSLWSSLVVLVPSRHHDIATDIAQAWLARSGQLPLSIRILSGFYNTAIPALADIINQYSTRWSDLDLFIPDCYYQHFHATDMHAPILKSIRFNCSIRAEIVNFQLTCPRLERAHFSCIPMDGTNIQWDNLTYLTLHNMSIIDSLLILRKTPRLVFCKVSGYFSRNGERGIGAPVLTSLRSLQTLTGYPEDFLNNLIAPQLEEFSLPDYYNPSMEVITSFLKRSACSLRSLSMIFSVFPPYFEGFMRLLQSMPSLNKLSIISIASTIHYDVTLEDYDPRNLLQLVAKVFSSQSTSLQQGFLPNLKILEYTGKLRPGNYDDPYSLPPADNTLHGPLHLLKLDLRPAAHMPKYMISYLSSLVERGVTVDIVYKSNGQDWIDNFDSSLLWGGGISD